MQKAYINPTVDQTYEIISGGDPAYNFISILAEGASLQQKGDVSAACNLRFTAIQNLQELLPEDDEISLEWNHKNSQAAIEVVNLSAVDHFLIGDFELASALLELSLELDPEDHLDSTNLLAYCYLAMEEFELFDEVINDISDKYATRVVLLLWSSFLRTGELPVGEIHNFKSRFAAYYNEFVAAEHPASEEYLKDIESERPSLQAQARELWFKTEVLWANSPEFIEKLRIS